MTKRRILDYQQKCFNEYIPNIGLPRNYSYPDGNPIRPLPPIKTKEHGILILGAYPSARFERRPSISHPGRFRTVPIADNLQPFGREEYFDGLSNRVLVSGEGILDYLLTPLSLHLDECWVTDLIKVFLYKETHIESCKDSIHGFKGQETRSRFKEFAVKSLPWIKEECEICQPKVVIALGEEVSQVVSGHLNWSATKLFALEPDKPESIGFFSSFYIPHPDACRRYAKWRKYLKKQIRYIKPFI